MRRLKNFMKTRLWNSDFVFKYADTFAWVAVTLAVIYVIIPALFKIFLTNGTA